MFASNSHAFTPETLTIHRFVRKLTEQVSSDLDSSWRSDPRFHHSVKTLLALIDGAEQSLSPNVHQSDATYSQLQQYKVEARGIRDLLEVPCQPSYIDPCRDSGDVIDAEASTYSDAQERAFSALRSPAGPNSILQNAQGLSRDAQHRLASHEGIQEDLTDQMVSLAGKLRQQAQAQAQALHDRDAVLDSASQGLLKSVQGVQAVVKDTKQAVKRTRRSMFFSFFVLLAVAGVFLGVYGFINVTSVTKMFVPYKTMASQWATKTVQKTKHVRQAAEPVAPAPPDPPAADDSAISDLEVDLTADEYMDAIESTEDASDEEVISGFDRFSALDNGGDAEEFTAPVPQHAQQAEEQPVHAPDPESQESVARRAEEISEASPVEDAGAEDGTGASDHPVGAESGDQELDEERFQDAEEDEYVDEDDNSVTDAADVATQRGTAQQEKDPAPEADAQNSSSQEASTDSTGADAAEEAEPPMANNEEAPAVPAQDDAPQRHTPEPVPAAGGSDVQDTDSSIAASPEEHSREQAVFADSPELEEAARDTESAEASRAAGQDAEPQEVAPGTKGPADDVDAGPESLPVDKEPALAGDEQMRTEATEASTPEAPHIFKEAEESSNKSAGAVVQPGMNADAAEVDAEAIDQPDIQSKPANTASDGVPAEATVASEDATQDAIPASAPEAATSVAAGEAPGQAPATATSAESNTATEAGTAAPEAGSPAHMAATAATTPDAAPELTAHAGAGAPDAPRADTGVAAENAAEDIPVDPHAAAGTSADRASVSNLIAASDAGAASGTRSEAQRPHAEAPVTEAVASAEDEANGHQADSAQDAGQPPGVEAAGHEDEPDEDYDPKEPEEPAAAVEKEEDEDEYADDEEEAYDDEEAEDEEGQEVDKDEDDEYYDPPESSEELPPGQDEEEMISEEDPPDYSEECSASDPSSCSTDDSPVDPKYTREALQAREWASSAGTGTLGGRDPGGGKFVAGEAGADLSHDAGAADSADSTAEPGPAFRDEL